MQTNKIYHESCIDTIKKMPDNFLDCVITSPPYWQLRDYGYEGQWGLEPTFEEYLEHLWQMMDELWRVLKPTGTCWINLGDTYGGGISGRGGNAGKHIIENPSIKGTKFEKGIKKPLNKCLLLIPHRFAIGCIERGWILRNDIIWAKPNGMPESVTDRFSKKHEYFFFFVKQQEYFFDLDSIRDKVKTESLERYKYEFTGNKKGLSREMIGYVEGNKKHLLPKSKYINLEIESIHRQGMNKERGNNIIEKRTLLPSKDEFLKFLKSRIKLSDLINLIDVKKTTIEHWFRNDSGFSYPTIEDWNKIKCFISNTDNEFIEMNHKMTYFEIESDDINKNIHKGKNPSDVSDFWDIPTKPSSNEHYASYNDALLKKPVLSGCPENGLVYDPFMGTGSTAEVCIRTNRNFIGSEMSDKYIAIANKRLEPFLKQTKLF